MGSWRLSVKLSREGEGESKSGEIYLFSAWLSLSGIGGNTRAEKSDSRTEYSVQTVRYISKSYGIFLLNDVN